MRKLTPFLLSLLFMGCSSAVPESPETPKSVDVAEQGTPDEANDLPPAEPTDESGFRQRGNAYFNEGAYDAAIEEYTAALSLKPDAHLL